MKKIYIIFAFVIIATLSSCGYSSEQMEEVEANAYERGYEDGYEDGEYDGRESEIEELIEDGLLRRVETVFLSKDITNFTYHGRYCDLADWDKRVLLQDALDESLNPCQMCGGDTETALAPIGTAR